jgi:outer membrane murein-binding lipoprotein Lpp
MTKKTEDSNSPFKIGPDRRFVTTASTIIALLSGCIYCTWTAANAFNKMERSIETLTSKVDTLASDSIKQTAIIREELSLKISHAWLADEQYRWVSQLKWELRYSDYSIPDPREFRISKTP